MLTYEEAASSCFVINDGNFRHHFFECGDEFVEAGGDGAAIGHFTALRAFVARDVAELLGYTKP